MANFQKNIINKLLSIYRLSLSFRTICVFIITSRQFLTIYAYLHHNTHEKFKILISSINKFYTSRFSREYRSEQVQIKLKKTFINALNPRTLYSRKKKEKKKTQSRNVFKHDSRKTRPPPLPLLSSKYASRSKRERHPTKSNRSTR